jgi:hypothetical protein
MSAESATLTARAAAERNMVDACTVTRYTVTATDRETGVQTRTPTSIYSGRCRVQQRAAARPGGRRDVGEASVVEVDYVLQLPMSVTGVQVEDVVAITASGLDPDLPGRKFRVASQAAKTHASARRLELIEVNS